MEKMSVRIPSEFIRDLRDVAALGFEHNESDVIRECLRRALPILKKRFIGVKQSTFLKKSVALSKGRI